METTFFYKDHRIRIKPNVCEIVDPSGEILYSQEDVEIPPEAYYVVSLSDRIILVSYFNIVTITSLNPFEYEVEDHELECIDDVCSFNDHLLIRTFEAVIDYTNDCSEVVEVKNMGFITVFNEQLIVADYEDGAPIIKFIIFSDDTYKVINTVKLSDWKGYRLQRANMRLDKTYVIQCSLESSISPKIKLAFWNPLNPAQLDLEDSAFNFMNSVLCYSSTAIAYKGEDDKIYTISKPKNDTAEPKPRLVNTLTNVTLLSTMINVNGSAIAICSTESATMIIDKLLNPDTLHSVVSYQLLCQYPTTYLYDMIGLHKDHIIINLRNEKSISATIGFCYLISVKEDSTLSVTNLERKYFINSALSYNDSVSYLLACDLKDSRVFWVARWEAENPQKFEWIKASNKLKGLELVASTEDTLIVKDYDGNYYYHEFIPEHIETKISEENLEQFIEEHPQTSTFKKFFDNPTHWTSNFIFEDLNELPFYSKTNHLDLPHYLGSIYEGVLRFNTADGYEEYNCPSFANNPDLESTKTEIKI